MQTRQDPAPAFDVNGRRPNDGPVKAGPFDDRPLPILVHISIADEQRIDDPVIEPSVMAPCLARADAGDRDEARDADFLPDRRLRNCDDI
uniref:hypothetical protein n=1 Tax=Thauera sp. SDU_THAU2 TaxID=3136633 RepID=UPI00311F0A8C